MCANHLRLIEEWFSNHDNDGDFVFEPLESSYTLICPPSEDAPFVYATKPSIVAAAIRHPASRAELGLVGRYGLISDSDAAWIRDVTSQRSLVFVGDMDPGDLMIYASLRLRLPPKKVRHLGVNDALLDSLQLDLPLSYKMTLSDSERDSLGLLREVFPDLSAVVGVNCAALLELGRKIELEAVVSELGSPARLLEPLFAHG